MIACRDVGHHPASHAVPSESDTLGISASTASASSRFCEMKSYSDLAPRPAIIERHSVPAAAPDGWYKRPSTETPWLGMSSTVMAAGCSRSGGESLEISA